MSYEPKPEHKFSFGLWTVCNRGRDPFGEPVRDVLSPVDAVKMLGSIGAWGVNLHDNDLVPIDATPGERDQIVREFKKALADHKVTVPMATVSLFTDPIFKDGAFTANDPQVRRYAVQKTMGAMDLGAELGAAPRPTRAGAPTTRSSACARRSTGCANTRSNRATATGSRSRPSRTSRVATSTWRPRATISGSSRRSPTRTWSA
jgi:xylose isomerase